MGIYKRGGVYWYRFNWNGQRIRQSTKQGNDKVARQMEAAHRTSLAKGEVGIRDKRTAPSLKKFCAEQFEPWAKSSFEAHPNTLRSFQSGIRRLTAFEPLAKLPLDQITNEKVMGYAASERVRPQQRGEKKGMSIASVNASLRVLRHVLHTAADWGVIDAAPKIRLLAGEARRERVISSEEERLYLSFTSPLLFDLAILLADTGMRPDEAYRLRWENIVWRAARFGTLRITHGKTPAARRLIPLTMRARGVLEMRWERAGRPTDGWVFPASTESGHIEQGTVRYQHVAVFNKANRDSEGKPLKKPLLRPFILYAFRHTFLTRLGESGCDAWTLARIAGHSSIAISSRYVHPSEDAMLNAISRLNSSEGWAQNEHNSENRLLGSGDRMPEVFETTDGFWRTNGDANSAPDTLKS